MRAGDGQGVTEECTKANVVERDPLRARRGRRRRWRERRRGTPESVDAVVRSSAARRARMAHARGLLGRGDRRAGRRQRRAKAPMNSVLIDNDINGVQTDRSRVDEHILPDHQSQRKRNIEHKRHVQYTFIDAESPVATRSRPFATTPCNPAAFEHDAARPRTGPAPCEAVLTARGPERRDTHPASRRRYRSRRRSAPGCPPGRAVLIRRRSMMFATTDPLPGARHHPCVICA